MKLFLIIFYIAVFTLMIRKSCKTDIPDKLNFLETKKHINNLNAIKDRLEQVENMITDIESCSPDVHQSFVSIVSGSRTIDLHIDGENQNTENLLKTLYSERESLRTSLSNEIRNIGERCNENCNEIYKKIRKGSDQL